MDKETFDSLVISLLDSDAMKGAFKQELSKSLNVPVKNIREVWLETTLVDGVAIQELFVSFINAEIKKENLVDLPFKYIYENCIVFDVGELFL